MKLINALALLSFLFTACSDTKTNEEFLQTLDGQLQVKVTFHQNGKVKSATLISADTAQNVRLSFDTTGHIRAFVLKKNGNTAHAVEYYENGRPMGLVNLDASSTGDAYYYYDNGNKSSEGRWVMGKQSGIWKEYNETGELIKTDTL